MPLSLENVSYIYGERTPFEHKALNDLNLTFKDGMITGLMGHTGSGKSTAAQMLNGLLRPTKGRVLLDGCDINESKKSRYEAKFKVGLVFQYPEYQLFKESVWEDIAYGPRNMKLSEDEVKKRVNEAAEFVGLTRQMLGKSPFELSGGQKRRAAIAGIIAMKPRFLVLDEPAAGLDPAGRDDILSQICQYKNSENSSVIIISHSKCAKDSCAGAALTFQAVYGTDQQLHNTVTVDICNDIADFIQHIPFQSLHDLINTQHTLSFGKAIQVGIVTDDGKQLLTELTKESVINFCIRQDGNFGGLYRFCCCSSGFLLLSTTAAGASAQAKHANG